MVGLDKVRKDISDIDDSMEVGNALDQNKWRTLVKTCKRPQWPVEHYRIK